MPAIRSTIAGATSLPGSATAAAREARRINPALNAFLQIFEPGESRPGPLSGVPIAIKDNICIGPDLSVPGDGRGYAGRTTAASRMLEHYESPYTATAVQRLLDAGAAIIGKTNLDEFAMGSSTEHSAFGPTRNPWDLSRVPGGSSGGSAAAVAAGIVPVALGSDTGGSIRQPAGLCGVVGVKPTYGRVSRYGLIAFASSLDQIGIFANCIDDAATVLSIISGPDPMDATSADRLVPDWTSTAPINGLRIGVPRQTRSSANHPGVAAAFEEALRVCGSFGAEIVDIDLPLTDHGIAAYYIVAAAEASSNLARFDGVRYGRRAETRPGEVLADLYARSRSEGFGTEVKRRIMLGTHVLSSGYYDAYYATALQARRRILADFTSAFNDQGCHCIAMPASPGPAFRLGEKTDDPLSMYLEDVYTVGVNLAGLPALVQPMGFVAPPSLAGRADASAGLGGGPLPVGLQLIAQAFDESTLFRAARMYERATDWHLHTPPPV